MAAPRLATVDGTEATLGPQSVTHFRQSFRGPLIYPDDLEYDDARAVWNGLKV